MTNGTWRSRDEMEPLCVDVGPQHVLNFSLGGLHEVNLADIPIHICEG